MPRILLDNDDEQRAYPVNVEEAHFTRLRCEAPGSYKVVI